MCFLYVSVCGWLCVVGWVYLSLGIRCVCVGMYVCVCVCVCVCAHAHAQGNMAVVTTIAGGGSDSSRECVSV